VNVWRWFWALLVLNVFDWLCTVLLVSKFGADIEANPIQASIISTNGPWAIGLAKVIGFLMVARLTYLVAGHPLLRRGIITLVVIFTVLAAYHSFILYKVGL
jgi:Domain of unknown function (DUF5658)